MKTKDQIVELLMDQLNYAYCDNCRFNDDEEIKSWQKSNGYENKDVSPCEDCHRKYQEWALRRCVAEGLAKEILK